MTCPTCAALNEAGRKFCGECGARLALACASCGAVNAPNVRFCGECGSPVAGAAASPVQAPAGAVAPAVQSPNLAPVAERRLVTVLFVDLVGFTTLSERRDPEAVRELLSEYFDLASEVIGRYGGRVEKFIGDAVMALWGAPTAHEDDAERAVRAALDLVDAVRGIGPGIQARCGVLTGEAAVTLGSTDQGMVAGDLVNTAARLQSAAAPGTVLVGDATHQATAEAVAYEAAGEHDLKGKALPVAAWRALRIVAERRGRGRDARLEAPFVGRDAELRLLKDLFHATARERRVRLVSITGQAGIGKSRLAWEFLKYVDGVVEQVWWHEGRSPSYGEGITFWALGEMVRSRAGLLESDDAATTRARIGEMLAMHIPDEAERRRIEPAFLALLGAGEAPAGGAPELFLAWRTFFERLASTGVVALLFEDLHWADPGTLDFVEHLLEWSRNVPILIITLARPELLDRRPGWGAGKRSFLALDLQALDEASMRELLAGLVPGLPEAAVRSIVARAEGIPLYAVETIRMLVADGRLVPREAGGYEPSGELGELAVPGTLHALIAARLDALDVSDRALLQDAAVLGQSFTADALAAIAGSAAGEIETRLDQLVRGDLLHVEVDPRSPERGQYAFVQALIREVAYSTLAMRDRRSRHLAAARYFESLADDELAGALAAHYLAAYRASAEGPEAEAIAGQARIGLRAAANRATALGSVDQAISYLEQALDVTTEPGDLADLHERAAIAAYSAVRLDLAMAHLLAASEFQEKLGDRSSLARLAGWQGATLSVARRRDEAANVLSVAFAQYEDLGDLDPNLVFLMRHLATAYLLVGSYSRALEIADRQLASSERLGLVQLAAEALMTKGTTAFYSGRLWEARALLQGSRDLAEEAGLSDVMLRVMVTLPSFIALDSPVQSLALQRDAIDLARRLGNRGMELSILFNAAEDARRAGEWDWAMQEMVVVSQLEVDASAIAGNRTQQLLYEVYCRGFDQAEYDEIRDRLLALEDRDMHSGLHDVAAAWAYAEGRWADSAAASLQVAEISDLNAPYALPRAGRAAVLARDPATAQAALDRLVELGARGRAMDADRSTIRAGLAALAGDADTALTGYRIAIAAYRDLGLPWDEACVAFEAATLLGIEDAEVRGWLEESRAIFGRTGAAVMLQRLDEVESRSTADPSLADATQESASP